MAEFTSSIELKAVTSQLDKKLGKVTKDLKGISVQAQKTQGAMNRMTKKVGGGFDKLTKKLRDNRAAIAGIGVAITGIALKGVSDFKKLEDGMKQIGTLGVKNLGKVRDQLSGIRREFGITGREATKGYYDIVSAGAESNVVAIERLTAATKLAKAGNTDLAGAIDILTGGLNVFKRDAITSTEITDKLFLAVKFGKTTVEELGQTFGMVAPMVKAAGGTFDDFATSMAVLTAGGLQTKQATTGLKGIMVGITKSTPKQAKEVARLGINFGVAAVEAEGLEGMLVNLKKAIDKDTSGDAQITMLNRLIDNSEAAAALDVMLSNMDNFSRISKEMETAAGTTATALEVVKASASFNFDKFNQSMSVMSENIGAAVVPGLIDMAESLAPIVDFVASFIAMHPGVVKLTVALTAMAVSLAFLGGPLTLGIVAVGFALKHTLGRFVDFSKGGTKALALLILKWDNFWRKIGNTKIGGMFIKMSSVSISWINKMMTEIRASIDGLFGWLATPFVKATEAIEAAFEWLYDKVVGNSWFPELIQGLKDNIAGIGAWFTLPFKTAIEAIELFFSNLLTNETFTGFVDSIKTSIKDIGVWLTTPFKNATMTIESYLAGLDLDLAPSATAKTAWNNLTKSIKDGWDSASISMKAFFEDRDFEPKKNIKDLWIKLTDALSVAWDGASDSLSGYFDQDFQPAEAIKKAWEKLTSGISTGWDAATASLLAFLTDRDLEPGEGIAALWVTLTDKITVGWNKAKTAVIGFLQQKGLYPEEGTQSLWETLTLAIKTGYEKATEALKNFWTEFNKSSSPDSEGGEGSLLRKIASLGVVGSLLRSAAAATLTWERAMIDLGIAEATPLTGLQKMGNMKFGSLVRQIQKVTQALYELDAAKTDDATRLVSKDAKTSARALENASKIEQKIRLNRIAAIKAMGQEEIALEIARQRAMLSTLSDQAKASGKNFKRGWFSRAMFGEGTMHTWEAKMNGLIERIGKGFDKMGRGILKLTSGLERMKFVSQEISKLSSMNVTSANANVKTAAMAVSKAEGTKVSGYMRKDGTKVSGYTRAGGTAAEIAKAQQALLAAQNELAAATKIHAENAKKTVTAAQNASKQMTPITKTFEKLGKVLSGFGSVFRVGVEQSTKVIGASATLGSKVANSKTLGALKGVTKSTLNFAKIPQVARLLGVVARKILIPLFAIYDAFKGFTELENLQANIPGAEEQTEFSGAEKTLSAISEAFGNFFNGFFKLGSMIAEYFGADDMADYLESIDLAPEFGKVFTTIKNLFKIIVNIFKAIFVDEDPDADESAFTKIIKTVGKYISKIFDLFVAISEGLLKMSEGDVGEGAWDIASAVTNFFLDLAGALMTGLITGIAAIGDWGVNLLKDLMQGIWDWVKGVFTKSKDKVDTTPYSVEGTDWSKFDPDGLQLPTFELSEDGQMKLYAKGGHVRGPGSGTSDDIPAMLSNGEYVMNAKQTDKNRALLEHLNNGGKLKKFADGGGADGKAYQFLQFNRSNSPHNDSGKSEQGGNASFNFERTMRLFVNHLDQANPQVKEVVRMMKELEISSSDTNEEQLLQYEYTKLVNRGLLELNRESKDLAEVTDGTSGAVNDFGDTVVDVATKIANEWAGVGDSLTQPIKDAFMNGGSIADGLKMGLHNMFKNVAGKFLDRAMKPMEDSLDNMLLGLFGNFDGTGKKASSGAGGGGLGGFISSLFSGMFSKGGIVPQYLATGGMATGYGPKGSDTVPAWLTPGEVVLNAGQQKNVSDAIGGGATYVTNTINVSGNVDQRAIDQIQSVIAGSPNQVNNASNTGKRNSSGIRRTR